VYQKKSVATPVFMFSLSHYLFYITWKTICYESHTNYLFADVTVDLGTSFFSYSGTPQESQLLPDVRSQWNYGIPNWVYCEAEGNEERKEMRLRKAGKYLAIQIWLPNTAKAISRNELYLFTFNWMSFWYLEAFSPKCHREKLMIFNFFFFHIMIDL